MLLKTVPAGYPGPRLDLIGCVHLITAVHLNTVMEAFQSCQWALECQRHMLAQCVARRLDADVHPQDWPI